MDQFTKLCERLIHKATDLVLNDPIIANPNSNISLEVKIINEKQVYHITSENLE